jgi:hypothetical protein
MNHESNTSNGKALRIAYLIAGYIQQTLTPKEQDELDGWAGESGENMLLFEQLTDEDNIAEGLAQIKTANEKKRIERSGLCSLLKKRNKPGMALCLAAIAKPPCII